LYGQQQHRALLVFVAEQRLGLMLMLEISHAAAGHWDFLRTTAKPASSGNSSSSWGLC
jgi:hypothetical protein